MENFRPSFSPENGNPPTEKVQAPDYHESIQSHAEQAAHFIKMREIIKDSSNPDSHKEMLDWINGQIKYYQDRIVELGDQNEREN